MTSHLSSKKNVRFYTVGCKVNQYETQAMRESLEQKGFRDIEGERGAPCDLVVVNTCTVTQDADRTSRYWIRRLRREHPKAKLAVTGCYVEKNRLELQKMPEIDLILSNDEKPSLAEKLSVPAQRFGESSKSAPSSFAALSVSRSEGKTRAYVKIQDGCDHACSFCKVSIVRGGSRSRPMNAILDEVKRLCENGYREIILTGIQLGAYGRDLGSQTFSKEGRPFLRDVIEACSAIERVERIRLSSIELMDLDRSVREAFRSVPKLCPHVHLPLQSGDNEVLVRMNRRYTREDYREAILELKENVPDFEFSADVMAGFPGETKKQFENTLELLKILRPLKTHVFPYSPREGTLAASWKPLPVKEVQGRVKQLMALSERLSREVRERYLGRSLEILAEHKNERTGISEGFTRNYLKVFFECSRNVQGCIIPLKLERLFQDGFRGALESPGQEYGRAF
ncbi:MAG TPA: tRNA (N(6)-L-threonylcarbamoyladenosine(37)-C(2))-methylthiotransferase MtaB [Candidatus Omnitrophota bacterium]|nr:tRNA (N(6)-L-threonylcarbamoyladenosine(37)-C(2))-methylthiotransferase MtaB [Candidatus Omnitrophota bacterium]